MSKRIALVGNSALTMYNFRAELIKDLLAAGYKVDVIAPIDRDIDIYQQIGVRFIAMPMDCRGTNPVSDYMFFKRLTALYKKERYDFIFHYTIKPVIYGSFAARHSHTPQISVITGLGYTFMQRGFLNRVACMLYKYALKRAKQVWFLNADDRKLFHTLQIVNYEKSLIIDGEGINTDEFKAATMPSKPFHFLYIGRLLWDKGIGELVAASKELKSRYPDVRISLLGPTNSSNPSAIEQATLDRWISQGIVNYLGVTTDIKPFVEQCHCVVLPSYREGISRVLLEACCMERPIVTTDTTGCRDIVTDGVNGYLCKPKDAASLTHTMEKMLQLSDEQLQNMGKAGREIVMNRFDQRIISRVYLETLAQQIGV